MRTRVGYCGGNAASPDYRHIGDHSETVELDYDPAVITYAALLEEFFAGHDAAARPFSTQYRSAIFYRTEPEWAAAEYALGRAEGRHGRVHTSIEPFHRFWMAEPYHQKFRLRGHTELFAELSAHFADDRAVVDSTSAARINGWLDGCACPDQLDRELPLTGLSENGRAEVRAYALARARTVTG